MLTNLCRSQLNDKNNAFAFVNPATSKVDCNVAQASQCVELFDGSQLTAVETRKLGQDITGPTGNRLTRNVFEAHGMVAQQDYQILNERPVQDVRDLLAAGWYVVLYVDYGVMNQLASSVTGDKNYAGYHAIGVSDWWRGTQGRSVHYHDPLNDGRHPNTPKGVQTVKFSHVRDAAMAYSTQAEHGTPGTIYGYAVKP